jgi:Tfp pilus assembly protein PilO
MKNLKLTKGKTIALIVGGDLLLLVFGWFLLVAPQRVTAQSNSLAASAAEAQVIEAKRPVVLPPNVTIQPKQPEIRTAYLYKLSKAMPMTTDMPNLLLELNQVVRASGVQLSSISPSTPDSTTGAMPITLAVTGDFYTLTDLLYRLRSLVGVRDGSLDVSGRLFSVQSVGLTKGSAGSELMASISVNTYSFGAASAAASAAAAAAAAAAVPAATDTSTGETAASPSADTAIGH